MADFSTRLAHLGLITTDLPMRGRRSQCQVVRVRNTNNMGITQAVKLIPSNSPTVAYDLQTIHAFKTSPFPDGRFVYRDCWQDIAGLAVLMDDYTCTLRDRISPDIQLTERQWLNIMLGIADRLSCAHQENYVHGDLCPANVLLNLKPEDNYEYDPTDMHISDFGIFYFGQLATPTNTAIVKGSREYLAPEIQNFIKLDSTKESDIWAVGVIGYEMCMGIGLTWNTDVFQEIKYHIQVGGLNLWRVPVRFGGVIHDILQNCLSFDPNMRPTASALRDRLRDLIRTKDMEEKEWQAQQNLAQQNLAQQNLAQQNVAQQNPYIYPGTYGRTY